MNFCFPVPPSLENSRLQLIPWIPSIHSPLLFPSVSKHPEIFNYLPFGPFVTVEDVDEWVEEVIHKNEKFVLFAIINKTQNKSRRAKDELKTPSRQNDVNSEDFAGMIGLLNTDVINRSTEIGFVIILPVFHRTHVASNAVGLLMTWLLDTPDENNTSHVLGLNRVHWSANVLNTKSIKLAERMGFKFEGVSRWERILPERKDRFGRVERRKGDPKEECLGRDTARLAVCWDDWEEGGRNAVEETMARTS